MGEVAGKGQHDGECKRRELVSGGRMAWAVGSLASMASGATLASTSGATLASTSRATLASTWALASTWVGGAGQAGQLDGGCKRGLTEERGDYSFLYRGSPPVATLILTFSEHV